MKTYSTSILTLCAVALALGAAVVLYRHMSRRTETSPDGKYVLTTFVERDPARQLHYLCVGLRMKDHAGNLLWEHRTRTPARETYETGWDDSSRRVWLKSGGTSSQFDPFDATR